MKHFFGFYIAYFTLIFSWYFAHLFASLYITAKQQLEKIQNNKQKTTNVKRMNRYKKRIKRSPILLAIAGGIWLITEIFWLSTYRTWEQYWGLRYLQYILFAILCWSAAFLRYIIENVKFWVLYVVALSVISGIPSGIYGGINIDTALSINSLRKPKVTEEF